MNTRNHDSNNDEQALDCSDHKNSQADLIETLQLQIKQLLGENLIQKNTISRLQQKRSVLKDELDDCEKDIAELDAEKLQMKNQIKALIEQNKQLSNINQKLLTHYQASVNGYNLPRRISFLTRNDTRIEDKPEADIPSVSSLIP